MVFDSTFSPILAQFQDEEPIPYADDEPILPKKEIAQALDAREERYSNLLVSVGFASTDAWWKTVEPALEKGDKDSIEKNPWKLSPNFQGLLYGLWTDTWDLGCFHAVKGLNIANQEAANEVGSRKSEVGSWKSEVGSRKSEVGSRESEVGSRKSEVGSRKSEVGSRKSEVRSRKSEVGTGALVATSDLLFPISKKAEFKDGTLPDYPQDPFYTAYPPDYGYPLRNTDLRAAVEQRTIYLADDVDSKTRDRIQQAVMEAVSQHKEAGIPKRDRAKLLQQINLALGRQSLTEIKDPQVPVGEKLVRTKLQIPNTQTFASRAKTIAATEVAAGYSLGRLQVYTQAGVKRGRWQTLEDLRVCKICRSRNGVVFDMDILLAQHQYAYRHRADPTQFIFPAHPACRCLPVPVVERRKKDRDMIADPGRQIENRQVQPLRGGWNTLKNAIGLTLTIASAVKTGTKVAQEIQQQQRHSGQQQESLKQEQAGRLARSLMVTGGAALSLGLLYMLMRNQQEVGSRKSEVGSWKSEVGSRKSEVGSWKLEVGSRKSEVGTGALLPTSVRQAASYLTRQQQIQQVKEQPVTPTQILTELNQQATLVKLPAGLDLRAISKAALRGLYGLTIAEAEMVEKLRKQYERDRITPPEQALIPQFFLPPELLNRYPGLKDIENLRDLSLKDLAQIILQQGQATFTPPELPQELQGAIATQVQNVLALPPAQVNNPPGQLMVGGVNLNTASVDEIAGMLPAGKSLKQRQSTARKIYDTLRRMSQLGTPITSLDELAAIPGVGSITVRNLQSRNYTQNLNNLLLQLGDKDGIDAIAGLLDVGPKLAAEIVREFRENGQFGAPGVDSVEDLINRVERRVTSNRRIAFSEDTKNRIRERLSGRMYVMPIPPTQPVGAVQTQSAGSLLLPATSPLDVPPPNQPFTPRYLVSPTAPQLPPPSEGRPIITPTSSLGFPSRVQPPITNPVIPVTSAEANQLSRRNTALDNYSSLSSSVNNYQSDLTEAVNAGRMPKVGLLGGGLKMDKHKANTFKKAQNSIDKTVKSLSGTEVNAAALNQLASSAEAIISELEARLQDLDDPLADPLFRNNGELMADVRNNLRDARNSISRGLGITDSARSLPDMMQQELQKRKEELAALRDRTETILERIDPSAKYQLGASLDSEIARLQALTPEQLGSYYVEVQQLIAQHQDLRNRVFNVERSDAIESIDGQIAAIDDVIQNAANLQRPELIEYLEQTRSRFIAARDRINSLPRTFDELTPPQQQQFVAAKAMRDRIRGVSLDLGRNLSALRKRLDKSRQFLDLNLEAYTNAIAPLQAPGTQDNETLHDQERRQGQEYVQNIINLSTQGIDVELSKLRNLADPVVGMSSVLDAIKQTSALIDVPALLGAPVEPGLVAPTPVEPDETIRGRTLDEAVRQRRSLMNQSAARITSSAILSSGFPYGYVQRIQTVIDPTSNNVFVHPDTVTSSRLTTVSQLIQELTAKRAQAYTEIQELATAAGSDLEQLRTLDPVAYQEIRLSPTWATIQQLKANAATQVTEYDNRLTALQQAAAELNAELQVPILYDYRGERLTQEQIRDRLTAVQQEVAGLIKKRRDDLTPIWNKVAPLTEVDSVGLETAIKGGRAPTPSEQNFISGLTESEQATLRDAANTGALDLFRRKVYLSAKEQELASLKAQMWGDPNNPERIRGRQVPKTILKNLELFNRKLRSQAGMKVVLVDNPAQARVDYQVVDLYDESAPNYQAEPGFKDYAGQPGVQKSLQRARRRLVAQGLIEEFEQASWVQETLGLLIKGEVRTINWRQYVDQIENRQTPSQVPTNYVEVTTALELIKARRQQIEGEMEVVGFKWSSGAMDEWAQFNRQMAQLKKLTGNRKRLRKLRGTLRKNFLS